MWLPISDFGTEGAADIRRSRAETSVIVCIRIRITAHGMWTGLAICAAMPSTMTAQITTFTAHIRTA
ncbi:MAG: hypothetical protein IKZ82_00845 [Clostridia bacterium]|nr:hypothetical protein [Clostridia bacterium]